MGRALVLLVAIGVAFGAAAPASAKWCARISATPPHPVVGQKVTLRLRTFEAVLRRNGLAGPGAPTRIGGPLMLLVTPPRGEFTGVDLRRRPDNAAVWEGTFVFRRAGAWRVQPIDETPLGVGCRGRITLRVLARR